VEHNLAPATVAGRKVVAVADRSRLAATDPTYGARVLPLVTTSLGALLALFGGFFVRRWESRRDQRARVLLEMVHPTMQALRNAEAHATDGDLVFPQEASLLLPQLEVRALSIGRRDYKFAARATALRNPLVETYNETLGRNSRQDTFDPADVKASYLPAVVEVRQALGDYERFLRRQLVRGATTTD
jgi:hypothetical protein